MLDEDVVDNVLIHRFNEARFVAICVMASPEPSRRECSRLPPTADCTERKSRLRSSFRESAGVGQLSL